VGGFSGHRRYSSDDVVVTSVEYGDFDILICHSSTIGYVAIIDGLADRDSETLGGYRTIADALQEAKQYIDEIAVETV
jgi:hypothetical protein